MIELKVSTICLVKDSLSILQHYQNKTPIAKILWNDAVESNNENNEQTIKTPVTVGEESRKCL